jgi:hypothetical protein
MAYQRTEDGGMETKETRKVAAKPVTPTTASERDLVITRIINAPPEQVFHAWTDPDLLKQWFAPHPWTTPVAATDVCPGDASLIVMRSPDGNEFPNRGVYLDVVTINGWNRFSIAFRSVSGAYQPQQSHAEPTRMAA